MFDAVHSGRRAAAAISLLLLSSTHCAPSETSNEGAGGNGGGDAGGQGGAGGTTPVDPLHLDECPVEAPVLGDPLPLPVLSWPAGDDRDLMCSLRALDAAVTPSRVVCLGENAHGVSESSRWHATIARYLVHRFGVREISFEAPGASVEGWNRYLESGDAADLDAGFDAPGTLADSEEQQQLVEALRGIRGELEAPLRLTGFDVAVDFDTTADHVVEFFAQVEPTLSPDPAASLHEGGYPERATVADDLAARISAHRADYEAATSPDAVTTALRDVRNLADGFRFLERYFQNDYYGGNKTYREPGIIRNIEESVARLGEGERLLVISHDGHCGRAMSSSGVPSEHATYPSLGAHLAQSLGSRYFVLGQLYGGGQQMLVDHTINDIHPTPGYLELALDQHIHSDAAVFSTSSTFVDLEKTYEVWNIEALVPRDQFDAILYLREVTPITLR